MADGMEGYAESLQHLSDNATPAEVAEFKERKLREQEGKLRSVVAKMQCNVIETAEYGPPSQYSPQYKVKLGAVYGKEGENKDFADATPSGECWMQINKERPALTFFKPGKSYYVTFTEADPITKITC